MIKVELERRILKAKQLLRHVRIARHPVRFFLGLTSLSSTYRYPGFTEILGAASSGYQNRPL